MNDLIRPALYEGWHQIVPLKKPATTPKNSYVVGPICETGDFLDQTADCPVEQGDILAVLSAGAYGFTMASNYNSRPLGRGARGRRQGPLVRRRQTLGRPRARRTCAA